MLRDTAQAKAGDYCWRAIIGLAFDGFSWTLEALTNAIHYASFFVYGTVAGELQVALNGNSFYAAAVIGGAAGGWVRYGVQIPAASANGSTGISIRSTAAEDIRIDCIQVEANSYGTTYIDGDQGPLYRWNGLRHGSSSTRDAQDRLGGRIRNLEDDYSVGVMDGSTRLGLPPYVHNLQGQSLQPGAAYQSYKVLPREIELRMRVAGDGATAALALANYHSLRRALIDLLKPSLTHGAQPVVLGYSGADPLTVVWAAFHYSSGLELGEVMAYDEIAPVKLLAVDPYWYEDNRETASLAYTASVANSAYANRRTNGQWLALGSGMNNTVFAIAIDKVRGRVYYGGAFTSANGVTVNGICYWNGTNFVAMDGGTNSWIYSIAVAANGDVWIGGPFTTVGTAAAATKGLARWNIATGTWTAFNESTGSFSQISVIAIKSTGQVVISGIFTNWEGDAASDYIASTDDNGVNWDSMGTSPFSATNLPGLPNSLGFDASGNLYATSENSGIGTGFLYKFDGTTWTTVGETSSGSTHGIKSLLITADSLIYVVGLFSTIGGVTASNVAVYNGSSFAKLGDGTNGSTWNIKSGPDGLIYIIGTFSSAGGIILAERIASWNGSVWVQLDIDLPGSPTVYALDLLGNDIFVGYSTTGTAVAAGLTTVSPTATAPVFPSFTLTGLTAGAGATLQWLENQSTGHRLYFNLIVYVGETITINLTPGNRSVVSDWRGVLQNQPLSNSDWAAFYLLGSPSNNVIAAFVTGTTTGLVMVAHWQPRHLSVDGVA